MARSRASACNCFSHDEAGADRLRRPAPGAEAGRRRICRPSRRGARGGGAVRGRAPRAGRSSEPAGEGKPPLQQNRRVPVLRGAQYRRNRGDAFALAGDRQAGLGDRPCVAQSRASVVTDSSLSTSGEQPGTDDWKLVETLLHEALDKDPSARAKFLTSASPDPAVRDRVESLLRAHDQPGRFDALSEAVMSPLLKVDRSPATAPLLTPTGSTVPDLERYRIVEKLGGGGMGIVYRARDERLDRDVALKFLPPHLSADAAAKKRFLVEARAAASLEHPNICTVHEIGETPDGQLYIVMGCYEGQTLDKRIDKGPLAPDEALRIAIEVGRGLAKAHDRRIVHRDIKPSNIMLTSDGLVKILDFGIAKLSDANVTQTFGVIGTLAYMSPEQAFGDVVDARADIWALGVVLYEMLMGQRPFGGPGQQALLYSILTAQVNTIDTVREDLTPGIDALLRRALAKKPDDRFASVHEMLAALNELQTAVTARPGPALRRAPQPVAMESVTAVRTESLLALAGERRHAAVVVTGIAGHAALVERLAPAEIDRVSNSIREIANEVATRYGGIVNHF